MIEVIWLLPLAPAVAGLAGLLVPLRRRRAATALGLTGIGVALVSSLILAVAGTTASARRVLADFGDIVVEANLIAEPVAAYVAVAVTVVAWLVQLYSTAYLRDDERYVPYAAQVSLFTAAMLLVVTADDLILLLVGWEVMGACSYLLIGHDRRLREAPTAAVKAFLVTRVGDVGLLLGIVVLGVHFGTFNITALLLAIPLADPGVLLAAGLPILAGAIGKSAQFPLHTWLPDAMAGPTPVSALIHAATMVAAGAYLLYRLLPLFTSDLLGLVLAMIAAVTMVTAALAALASDDLKRVLAWSTVSQVAFMFAGIAVAAGDAAMFHLLSHAAFKALLFLGAGAVIHMVASNAMFRMGGLRRGAPVTFWTMTLGFAALAGLPPLSGFWSKEGILAAAAAADTSAGTIVLWAGIVTVGITAAYATRAWLRTFFADRRSPARPHDPGPAMWIPLVVLSVPTVLLGAAGFVGPVAVVELHVWPTVPVLAVAALGAGGMWWRWRANPAVDPVTGRAAAFAADGFGFDGVQDRLVTRPLRGLARAVRRGDTGLVDGAVEGVGRSTSAMAALVAQAHTAGVPRHLLSALAGVAVIVLVGLAAYWGGFA
ncbi:MAG TPA: NADH-quinone oxidoreductase subunit L [Candidatus Stackebrandtia excrementipullorum]|nr:NADH-quinone oxidoreductase subunit L [Candidatus Stackebrandtia excrementipullorum]